MGFGPTVLYHQTASKGQTFYTQEDFDQALKDGWVEAPWLINQPKPKTIQQIADEEMAKIDWEDGADEEEPLKPWQKALAARKAKAQAKKEPPKPIESSGED